jgi:hypothetical protein
VCSHDDDEQILERDPALNGGVGRIEGHLAYARGKFIMVPSWQIAQYLVEAKAHSLGCGIAGESLRLYQVALGPRELFLRDT